MTPDEQSTIPVHESLQENITLETFHNITVRKVMQNGRGMIPVVDIADAVKLDRSNLSKHLKTFKKYYEPYKGVVKITTTGGSQPVVCLTRDGILGLLFKINASKSKDPEIVDRILAFQHWATSILSKNLVGDLTLHQEPTLTKQATLDCINYHLDIADIAITRSDVPKEIAHKQAWALAAGETKEDLVTSISQYIQIKRSEQLLSLPEAIPEDVAAYQSHFSRRQIAGFLKLSDDKVRNILEDKKIIVMQNGIWHLTKFGEQFGKVFWITPQAPYVLAKEARIKYNPGLLKYLEAECGLKVEGTKVPE